MAQDTTPAIVVYQGDGSNNTFSVPFDKGYYGEVKVLFVRRGLADYTYDPVTYVVSGRLYAWASGSAKVYTHTPNPAVGAPTYNSADVQQEDSVSTIAGQTITVGGTIYSRAVQHDIANNMLLTWNGDTLQVGDFICIARDTERGQPYELPNNQKHIEFALDNLERQIQEVKGAVDNALIVDPSHTVDPNKMNPLDWMKSIIRATDFSVRGLRVANGWLDYSLDDPNIADEDKTWNHLLNTDNIKNLKEVVRIDPETLVERHDVYYVDKDGVERPLNDAAAFASKVDEITIILNEEDKLEVQAVRNRNTAEDAIQPVYDWVGTQEEYIQQNIAEQHPDWLCFITDDAFDTRSTYIFEQGESSTSWHIVHNLNKYPSVTVVDSAGTTIDCSVIYINSNECELKFNAAFKGAAYLN